MNYIVSFSGGKDSTAVLLRLLEEKKPVDEIVFHQYNEIGEHSMITSSCSSHSLDIGPLVIVDNCGNAVRTKGSLTNPVDLCFPYPTKCPGQTCKVDL